MKKLLKNWLFPIKSNNSGPDINPKGIRYTLVDAEYWKLFPENDVLKLSKNVKTI